MPTRKMPRIRSRIFHVPKGIAYMIGNSPVGIWLAVHLGFMWIDLDVNMTKDGVLVFAHWPKIRKDKFVLPAWFREKYGNDPKISDVMWVDLHRLRTKKLKHRKRGRRGHVLRYYTVAELMGRIAKTKKLGIAAEWKFDRRFETPAPYTKFEFLRIRAGLSRDRVMHMTLQNGGNPWARLRAMRDAEVGPKVLLARGNGVPRHHEPYIDFVRGPWHRI